MLDHCVVSLYGDIGFFSSGRSTALRSGHEGQCDPRLRRKFENGRTVQEAQKSTLWKFSTGNDMI